MDLILPDFGLLVWTGIVFCLLFFLLVKFAWKPILSAVNTREQKIAEALDLAEKTKADYGSISILITCAGVAGSNAKLVAYDPDEWKSIIDINLNGTFNCCRAIL